MSKIKQTDCATCKFIKYKKTKETKKTYGICEETGLILVSKQINCKFYKLESLKEFYRILDRNGVLIFKCQDCVISSKNLMSHVIVMNQAYNIGFYPKDLFILNAKSRLISGKVKNQYHARKFHSYFWVFEKRKSKVDYRNLI